MTSKKRTVQKSGARNTNPSIVAVLENIRSIHNVGSIFRTADAAGVSKIYLCGITPAPIDRFGKIRRQFAKIALGAEKYLPWEKVVQTSALIERLKREGYSIFGLEQSKRSVPYYRFRGHKAPSRVALVVGNEVRGLSASTLRAADRALEILMGGGKESLNVSVAFGIAVFGIKF